MPPPLPRPQSWGHLADGVLLEIATRLLPPVPWASKRSTWVAVDTNPWRRGRANGDHGKQGPRGTWGKGHGSQVIREHTGHSAIEALSPASLEYVR